MRADVREALLGLDFEKRVQLPGLIPFCVFFAGVLNDFDELMIIRDRVAFLVRTQNLRDFSFELVRIYFHS